MKKLFSIALVIALAVSCLAIFPAAEEVIHDGSYWTYSYSFEGNILTLRADFEAVITGVDPVNVQFCGYSWDMEYDPAQITPLGTSSVKYENNPAYSDDFSEEGYFNIGCTECDWTVDINDGHFKGYVSTQFQLADSVKPGDVIEFQDCDSGCGTWTAWVTYEDGDSVFEVVVPEAAPTYEAPAAAEYQTLAGCELCGTAAGVRFIATVDAAADEFGMYITANGTTVTLSSNDAGFVTKAETADTITFTAVIFSDAKFEVVVFEKYGDTEVKSAAGTN